MALDELRRTSFGRNARQYDAARPSYPEAAIDEVIGWAGAQRVLEVGAGTGKATLVFARRPIELTAIEPDAQMAAVLRAHVAGYSNVTVVETKFEVWSETGFDLVVAAQSFHWIEPEARYRCAAAALRPGGALAILMNEKADLAPSLRGELDDAYTRWRPDAKNDLVQGAVEAARTKWTTEIDASGLFGPVHGAVFPWSVRYTSAEYVALVETYSDHAVLEDVRRAGLNADIAAAIDRHGGVIEIPYVTVAVLARTTG